MVLAPRRASIDTASVDNYTAVSELSLAEREIVYFWKELIW